MEDKFEQFLDKEISLNLSPKDTIERIKWYYTQYFKQVEISDEEIEKIPLEDALRFTEWMSSLINSNYKSGGNWYHKGEIVTTKKLYEKWYREQLKKKQ